MAAFLDTLPAWIVALTGVVTAANAITALTPTTVDNKIVSIILKFLNVLSINVLRNRNADDD